MLFLFLDGVGLGEDDPGRNPMVAARLPTLRSWVGGAPTAAAAPRLEGDALFRPLDAGLGHDGLPQSATGQTALLTGRNGAAMMGRHYGPWPGPTLRRALTQGTLFHDADGDAALANVYPPGYFEALASRRLRPNAPVVAARAADVVLRDLDAYRAGAAVPADLTGEGVGAREPTLRPLDAVEAARRLAGLANAHRFTFLDVWPTDQLGHARAHAAGVALLERLDAVLAELIPRLAGATLVLTSDHGNLEDLSTARHTTNPVPLLALGPAAGLLADAASLTDVAPALRRWWSATA